MLATAHTFAGATIALKIQNPWAALPLALLSHFVLDTIPHWDFFTFRNKITRRDKIKTILDFLVGLSVGMFFVLRALPNKTLAATIFFSCALANLPDALEAPYIFFGRNNNFIRLVMKIQHIFHSRLCFPWGLLTQLAFIDLCLLLLNC